MLTDATLHDLSFISTRFLICLIHKSPANPPNKQQEYSLQSLEELFTNSLGKWSKSGEGVCRFSIVEDFCTKHNDLLLGDTSWHRDNLSLVIFLIFFFVF